MKRPTPPDWPRLMAAELAAQYLSVPASAVPSLGVPAVDVGYGLRYDRTALDAWVDRAGGPTGVAEAWKDE